MDQEIIVEEKDAGEMTVQELLDYILSMPENAVLEISFWEDAAYV